jgi:hypothetical protein
VARLDEIKPATCWYCFAVAIPCTTRRLDEPRVRRPSRCECLTAAVPVVFYDTAKGRKSPNWGKRNAAARGLIYGQNAFCDLLDG